MPEGIDVVVEYSGEPSARGDRVLLRQVLIGLLTNAFKHTPPPGRVEIRARCRSTARCGSRSSTAASGIAPEDIDRIFERFYRGTGSLEKEGFGLGLSIARRMVDVMGGELEVEVDRGQGSTFTVRLRAAQPATTPVA